jgi:hydroxyethylthiazole kinase
MPMNKMLRKYLISKSDLRLSHFLSQVGHETGWWQFRQELGSERYFRTMYEVITINEAAEDFRSGLATRLGLVRRGETEQEYSVRRSGVVANKARDLHNGIANFQVGGQAGDGSRFRGRGFLQITARINYKSYSDYRGRDFTTDPNPELLAIDDTNACDASGFYWARERVNNEADGGAVNLVVDRVGGVINRGRADRVPLHNVERRATFFQIWRQLRDNIDVDE